MNENANVIINKDNIYGYNADQLVDFYIEYKKSGKNLDQELESTFIFLIRKDDKATKNLKNNENKNLLNDVVKKNAKKRFTDKYVDDKNHSKGKYLKRVEQEDEFSKNIENYVLNSKTGIVVGVLVETDGETIDVYVLKIEENGKYKEFAKCANSAKLDKDKLKNFIMSKSKKDILKNYFDNLGGNLDKIIYNIRKFDSPPAVASKSLKVLKNYNKEFTNQKILEKMKSIGQIDIGIIRSMEREIITEVTEKYKEKNGKYKELSIDYELRERELSNEEKNQLRKWRNELREKREEALKEFYENTVGIDDIISQKFSENNVDKFNEELASHLKEDSVNAVNKENFAGDFFIDTINRGTPYLMKKICNKLNDGTIDVIARNILENPEAIIYSRTRNFIQNDSERKIVKRLLKKIKEKCKGNVKQIAEEIVKIKYSVSDIYTIHKFFLMRF